MLEIREPKTEQEIQIVLEVMKRSNSNNINEIYGIWKEGKCLCGMITCKKGELDFLVTVKHGILVGKALYEIFKKLLPKYNQLLAIVNKNNYPSIKLCKQLGFRKIFDDKESYYFVLSKETWAYQKRWKM